MTRVTEAIADARTVVLTGATSGIGLATARLLAPRIERLLVHGPEPAGAVAPLLANLRGRARSGATVEYFHADYTQLASVAQLARQLGDASDHIDVVVNNAGSPARKVTTDANEMTLQVNYLAPVALTSLMLDGRSAKDHMRVVNVASATHLTATLDLDDLDLTDGYTAVAAYARAKLALVTYSCGLARALPESGVEVVSLHPGVIATGLLHAMFGGGGDRTERAAETIVEVVGRSHDSGTYYDTTRPAAPNPVARDPAVQQRLIERTTEKLAAAGISTSGAARPTGNRSDPRRR